MSTLTAKDLAVITAAPIMANTSEMTRAEWLQLRRGGLGGSDAAAVLGISKWASSYTLWLDKTGQSDDSDHSTLAQRTGTFLEPHVIAEAERDLAHEGLVIDQAPYMLHHPDHPVLFADVDGLAWMQDRRHRGGYEGKTAEPFGAGDWSDGVPGYYDAQVHHYMGVTGLDWWLVAVLIGFGRLATFVVERDDAVVEALVAAELAWWQRHITDGEPPKVDGSKAATQALALIEARAGLVHILTPDEEADVEDLFRQLAYDRAVAEEAKAGQDLAKNTLRHMLGEATELEGPDGRRWATWRPNKTGTRTLRVDAGLNHVTTPELQES